MGTQAFDHQPTHEEVLNALMANSCNVDRIDSEGTRVFTFDLHCMKAWVYATVIEGNDPGDIRYNITALELEST